MPISFHDHSEPLDSIYHSFDPRRAAGENSSDLSLSVTLIFSAPRS